MSCSNSRFITGTYMEEIDREEFLLNSKTGIKVNYYGDYRFEKLNKRTTVTFDKVLLRSIKKNGKSKKLYDSYTSIDPYVSSIGLWYKKNDAQSIKKSRVAFITSTELPIIEMKKVDIKDTSIQYLRYSSKSSKDDSTIVINYCEYLIELKVGSGSIIFWTTNSSDWLERESLGVIKTLSIEAKMKSRSY